MHPNFIIDLWPWWIAGLIICPLVAILPQLKNIREAIDKGDKDPNGAGKLFLKPFPLIISVIFGMATMVSFILFLASVIIGMVAGIRNLFM